MLCLRLDVMVEVNINNIRSKQIIQLQLVQ